jgi:hypothetical protein
MTAEPGGVWKATITVMPRHVEPITAEVIVVEAVDAVGPDEPLLEVTASSDRVRRYVPMIKQQEESDGTAQDARQQGQDSV